MPLRDYLSAIDLSALPDTFLDDVLGEYDADIVGANALIEQLTAEVATLKATLQATQAHNYQLLTAIESQDDTAEDVPDDDEETEEFDDFFSEDGN